ncbi:MAG: flagellin [Candidatus Sericytochromatia bacterium]|nr:flagellin [Candidatus Tanganyikabacteria bacterium]
MPSSVHTFVPQLRSARLFNMQTDNIANEVARLSSGERMLRATDNAASIAISGGIRTKIISYNQASRNAQDAQNMLQTAEGGLDETAKMLQRMRELVLRGTNDTLTDVDRAKVYSEIENLWV